MADLLKISTLGNLTIRHGERPVELPRKAEALLIYLACTGQTYERELLAELLWSEQSQERALTSLRVLLTNLRRELAPFLTITRRTVAFAQAAPHWLDVAELEAGLALGRQFRSKKATFRPEDLANVAARLALYQGDFLAGFFVRASQGFEEWLLFERERLQFEVIEALHGLVAAYMASADYPAGIKQAQRALQLDPLREETHSQLMRLYALSGQRHAALAQYETCRELLAAELGVEPAPETTMLLEQIRTGELSGPGETPPAPLEIIAPVSGPVPPLHVPSPATPLLGRDEILEQIDQAVRDPGCRLLTLIGPGGIGKTRLAIEAARQASRIDRPETDLAPAGPVFADGIYFISLAPLNSPDLMVAAVANALNFTFYDGLEPLDQLLSYLREKRLLLVLDNLEHILDGTEVLSMILTEAPGVKLLAVSRERLNLRGERLLPIPGLGYPTGRLERGKAGLAWQRYSAIQLFVTQAQAVDPDFATSPAELASISRICQLVEGIPLAVELAATWVRMLSCQEIVQEIETNLDFLVTTLHDVPERHRSLRAVFEYSWQLLSDEEKQGFRKLAIFQGGFSREAAQAVAGVSLPLLLALTDKSLLRRTESGRYERHLLLWQYGAEKLAEDARTATEVAAQHCAFFMAFLQKREALLKGGNQPLALAEISADIDNIRAAWVWALAEKRFGVITPAADSLFFFYEMRNWFQEGLDLFGRAVARLAEVEPEPEPATATNIQRGKLLARQGWFAFRLGQHDLGRRRLEESLAWLEPAGTAAVPELIFTRNYLGAIYVYLGGGAYDQAKAHLQENLPACRARDDQFGLSIALNILGWVAYLEGNFPQAQQLCRESLDLKRAIGDRWGMAFSLDYLGRIAYTLADYRQAQHLFQQSLIIYQELNDRYGLARSFSYLGDVALAAGEAEQAQYLYQESRDICRAIGNRWGYITALADLAKVFCRRADYPAASAILVEALEWAQNSQAPALVLEVLLASATFLSQTGRAEPALAVVAVVLNHPASSRDLQDQAARLLAELEPHRSTPAPAPKPGQDLRRVVGELLFTVKEW